MTYQLAEIRDIGRFVRARRMAVVASESIDFHMRRRHVPYLTQNDLAELIDVSTVVISQIEQGRYPNLTATLLTRIGRALSFSQQQQMFVLGLLEERSPVQIERVTVPQWIQDSVPDAKHPTMIISPAYDFLSWNSAVEDLFGVYASKIFPAGNGLIPAFTMSDMAMFFKEWDEYARSMVSGLRMSYAVHPDLRDYILDLATNLAERSPYFRELWELDDPLVIPTIEKDIDHPSLGSLRVMQIISVVVEAPKLTKIDFLPADDETRRKLASIRR